MNKFWKFHLNWIILWLWVNLKTWDSYFFFFSLKKVGTYFPKTSWVSLKLIFAQAPRAISLCSSLPLRVVWGHYLVLMVSPKGGVLRELGGKLTLSLKVVSHSVATWAHWKIPYAMYAHILVIANTYLRNYW